MKSKTWLILLLAAALIFGAVGALLLFSGTQARYAEVLSDGEVLCVLDLQEDRTYTVESAYGINVITVSGGKIAVTEADCPDGICKEYRPISYVGETIICLPHKVVVEIVGDNADTELDVAV